MTTATSGDEALAWFGRQPFAVVITDLVMDGVDGLRLLREAQRLHPPCRVILMSALATVDSAISALRDGAYDYLTKPFRMSAMSDAVKRALAAYPSVTRTRKSVKSPTVTGRSAN